ncbi:MAG: hypothetical protein HKN43_09350, partial [Rhodothermales bacterium]|nr:hypothetical protein [Rhodothermales bacterium]
MKEKTVLQEYPTHLKHTNGSSGRGKNEQVFEDDEMSLHDLLEILLKGKWIILACFAAVITLTAVYTFTKAPEYESKSLLQVNTDQSTPQLGDLLGMETGFRNVLNEIEILKSRTIAMKVAEEILTEPQIEGELSILRETDEGNLPSANGIVARLGSKYITIRPVSQDVDFIEVVAASTNPHEAALIANLYAENYLDYNLTSSRARMTASREFLDEVTGTFYSELQSAENQLRTYLTEENVVAPDEEARQLLEQITDLQREQYQTRLELGMTKAEIVALEEELNLIQPGLARQISSSDNLVIEGLSERIAELTLEREEKLARNPTLKENPEQDAEMVQINSQIASLRTEMDSRAN